MLVSVFSFCVSLTNLEEQWKKWIEEHSSREQTISNCLVAAAYLCYCGPFEKEIRFMFRSFFTSCCEKYSIPREPHQIFKATLTTRDNETTHTLLF